MQGALVLRLLWALDSLTCEEFRWHLLAGGDAGVCGVFVTSMGVAYSSSKFKFCFVALGFTTMSLLWCSVNLGGVALESLSDCRLLTAFLGFGGTAGFTFSLDIFSGLSSGSSNEVGGGRLATSVSVIHEDSSLPPSGGGGKVSRVRVLFRNASGGGGGRVSKFMHSEGLEISGGGGGRGRSSRRRVDGGVS